METVHARNRTVGVGVETNYPAQQVGSAVSWAAIIAGAALFQILIILGIGVGLILVSLCACEGLRAGTFGIGAIVWVTFTFLAAMSLPGNLAGRLRTRWTHVASDEIFLRDTEHGFLTSALTTTITVGLMASVATTFVAAGKKAAASVMSGTIGVTSSAAASDVVGLTEESEGDTLNDHIDRLYCCGGIEVPRHQWRYTGFGKDKKYSDNQAEHLAAEPEVFRSFDASTDAFADSVDAIRKVQAGKYRSYGLKSPGLILADAKLAWRSLRMKLGMPPEGSSPAKEQDGALNQDATSAKERSSEKNERCGLDHNNVCTPRARRRPSVTTTSSGDRRARIETS
jgi:hypothetical protein